MKIMTTTEARKRLGQLVEAVGRDRQIVGIGRRDQIEALLIKYPAHLNPALNSWTQFAANSSSLDWLSDEPELYTKTDIKGRYA